MAVGDFKSFDLDLLDVASVPNEGIGTSILDAIKMYRESEIRKKRQGLELEGIKARTAKSRKEASLIGELTSKDKAKMGVAAEQSAYDRQVQKDAIMLEQNRYDLKAKDAADKTSYDRSQDAYKREIDMAKAIERRKEKSENLGREQESLEYDRNRQKGLDDSRLEIEREKLKRRGEEFNEKIKKIKDDKTTKIHEQKDNAIDELINAAKDDNKNARNDNQSRRKEYLSLSGQYRDATLKEIDQLKGDDRRAVTDGLKIVDRARDRLNQAYNKKEDIFDSNEDRAERSANIARLENEVDLSVEALNDIKKNLRLSGSNADRLYLPALKELQRDLNLSGMRADQSSRDLRMAREEKSLNRFFRNRKVKLTPVERRDAALEATMRSKKKGEKEIIKALDFGDR